MDTRLRVIGDPMNEVQRVKIHTNCFVPVVFPVRLAHKIDLSKCVVLLTHPSFEVDNDKRRRSNWRCGRGSEEWEVQEACRAVSSYLGELGVSLEDSVWMASKSPEYVKMLVEGVRDLEQWHEWDAGLSFRDKILHIAPQKGDKGKVAYLETLGFSLSSSMNIARYFSADTLTLPSLMHKMDLADKDYAKLLLKYPWLLSTSIQDNSAKFNISYAPQSKCIKKTRMQKRVDACME
ncbi:hypothetical protein AAZX31_19G018300 [Glycine max]|uniref:Uncharacterized protein n=2 Tax=Glycine subgen. Soja TaxID=1462606 RepID=A0A445FB69_GLYSO|nr:uncharacterized protein LOC114400398 [Glycine soja]RZB46065.1 hypothetical protein D0Y65_050197 [Glycine soja]|eukprot:XP_006604963.1 uncharacterized protein LOC102667327 [Glycine max]